MAEAPLKLISIKETCGRVSLSRTSVYHAVVGGTFPKPVVIGPGRKAFVAAEVDAWIQARITARDAEAV